MNIFALLFLLATPPSSFAGEELFTIEVEHFENSHRPGLEGREWDLKALLTSFGSRLQWVKSEISKNQGRSLCLRIRQTVDGRPNGIPLPMEHRVRALKNILAQLRQREAEMRQAGAHYRINYPSTCDRVRR